MTRLMALKRSRSLVDKDSDSRVSLIALQLAQDELAALHASSSWLITAPLRWAGRMVKAWFKKPVAKGAAPIGPVRDYSQWVIEYDSHSNEVITNLCAQVHGFAQLPLFSILLPVDVIPLANLSKTVASVQQQIYPHWELCIALSASTPTDVRAQVESWAAVERRIKFIQAAEASSNLNNVALSLADDSSAHMIKIFAADIIAVQAIFTMTRALNEVEKCELLYADEDVLNAAGERSEPFFKPNWNDAFHTSRNLIGRFGCYRTSRVRELGGYLVDGFGAADFDLSLRYIKQIQSTGIVHIPHVLFHAGQAEVLANDPAYSPNLTLNAQDFSLAWPPRVPSLVRQLDLQPGQSPLYERLATLRQGLVRVAYLAENVHSSTFRYRAANMAAVLNVPVTANEVQTSAACFFSGDLSHASYIVASADILVITRVRHDFATAAFVQQFKAQGKKVWFDIDDWVFDPQAIGLIIHTAGQAASDEVLNYWHAVVSRMGQMLLLCDGAITTNHYLAQKIAKFANVPVKVIPNFANEQQLIASQPLYEKKTGQASSSSDSMRLGYFSGSASHNRDIALLLPALEIVMAGDPRVKLVLVGPVELGEYAARFEQNYNQRIERHAFTDYVDLQQLIAGVDFNLVPLQANEFTHCKSELKYVDAANVGTLTIASPTHAYAAAIRHRDNGYLAEDDRWLEVLLLAIATKDADLQAHQRMTATAYQDVQNRFTYKTQREVVLLALEVSHDLG